jgi:hypothetical protein
VSLAADLIKGGVASADIRTVTTQSELIDRYEDERLPTQPLKRAVSAAITTMVFLYCYILPTYAGGGKRWSRCKRGSPGGFILITGIGQYPDHEVTVGTGSTRFRIGNSRLA